MANEIQRSTRISWSKNGAQIVGSVTERMDQAGTNAIENVQIIQGTSEALVVGDVTGSAVHFMFKNMNELWDDLDDAAQAGYTNKADYNTKNTVFVGTINPTTAADAAVKLAPGAGVSLTSNVTEWYACKATDNVDLLVIAIEA